MMVYACGSNRRMIFNESLTIKCGANSMRFASATRWLVHEACTVRAAR